jgi:hypothetical protein
MTLVMLMRTAPVLGSPSVAHTVHNADPQVTDAFQDLNLREPMF